MLLKRTGIYLNLDFVVAVAAVAEKAGQKAAPLRHKIRLLTLLKRTRIRMRSGSKKQQDKRAGEM